MVLWIALVTFLSVYLFLTVICLLQGQLWASYKYEKAPYSISTNFLALLNLRLRLEGNPNPLNLKVFCRFFIFWKSYYLFYIVSVKTRKLSHFNANLEWRVFKLIFRIFFLISLFFCKTIKPHKLYKKTFK